LQSDAPREMPTGAEFIQNVDRQYPSASGLRPVAVWLKKSPTFPERHA
jgi:hypothetical protein